MRGGRASTRAGAAALRRQHGLGDAADRLLGRSWICVRGFADGGGIPCCRRGHSWPERPEDPENAGGEEKRPPVWVICLNTFQLILDLAHAEAQAG